MRIVYWLLVGFSVTLSGCSALFGDEGYFRNREDDYLKADSLPSLKVPETLNQEAVGQLYPIPELTEEDVVYAADTVEFETPRPEPLSSSALVEQVKIQRLDDQRWILVNVDPAELWPRIREFLSDNSLQVASTDTDLGLMETAWLSFKDDPDRIDRYRIRIDRGVQPDTSEIHVLHMSLDRESATQAQLSDWPDQSSDQERESWMVDELAASLAAEDMGAAGGTSLIAQNIGGNVKARVTSIETEPVMVLELSRARALATLTHAAQQQGFVIYDSDAARGEYYLGYREPPEKEPGWFARLFGAEKDPKPPETRYTLSDLREALPEGLLSSPEQAEEARKALPKAPGHLLIVTEDEGRYLVRLRGAYGERMSARKTREMLTVLRTNLI